MIYILMLSVLVLLIITMQLFNKDMTAPDFSSQSGAGTG